MASSSAIGGTEHASGGAVAEIGLDHACVGGDRLWRAFGDDAALGEHEHMLCEAQDGLHYMLDHHDAGAAFADGADYRYHVAHLGRVEAGEHFVKQKEFGFNRERTREL